MENKKFKFNGHWVGISKTGLDYSRKLEKQYKEIPPYAKNEKGEFINDKSVAVLVEAEPFDIDEYIQSFKDECDIYKILEKAYLSQNISLLNQYPGGVYDDISDLPDDPFEMEDINNRANEALVELINKQNEENKDEVVEQPQEEKKDEVK